jgi:glucose/arabinose dehydrogenase
MSCTDMLPRTKMPNTFDRNAIRGGYRQKAGFARQVAVAVFTASLSACGGGGGSLTSASPPSLALSAFATGFTAPLGFETPDDGTSRNFVVEQRGTIRIIQDDTVLPRPFLDISSKVESGGEKGLLGLAFHPDYRNNGRFFVNYTRRVNAQLQTVVAELRVSSSGANQADPASERRLLVVDQPFDNHNGGQLAFGADRLLYIGLGDGGGSGDPLGNGQNRSTLLGKMLRIDVDSPPASGKQYAIPADNPFVSEGGLPEVFAWGLRNPLRFSFDVPTGRLFAGDVGENRFEEVDLIAKGENFGWNIMEGNHCFAADPCNKAGLTPPIAEYAHDAAGGISIVGGHVYRGSAIPRLVGAYVFGDFTSGRVWALVERPPGSWQMTLVLTHGLTVSAFGRDRAGELYVIDYGNGAILRLRSAP